jgi:nucleotide-binding universal stress UspA family protein
MNKILLAVDDTKGSLSVVDILNNLLGDCVGGSCVPRTITLLYVQRLEGRSIMDGLLLSTVLNYFKDLLKKQGFSGIKSLVRQGHPAEEILKASQEEEAEMIVMGSRGKRLHNLWMGSISREVANNAEMAVLIAK